MRKIKTSAQRQVPFRKIKKSENYLYMVFYATPSYNNRTMQYVYDEKAQFIYRQYPIMQKDDYGHWLKLDENVRYSYITWENRNIIHSTTTLQYYDLEKWINLGYGRVYYTPDKEKAEEAKLYAYEKMQELYQMYKKITASFEEVFATVPIKTAVPEFMEPRYDDVEEMTEEEKADKKWAFDRD